MQALAIIVIVVGEHAHRELRVRLPGREIHVRRQADSIFMTPSPVHGCLRNGGALSLRLFPEVYAWFVGEIINVDLGAGLGRLAQVYKR